jgi:peptide/nickel transport system substrate-binding protein
MRDLEFLDMIATVQRERLNRRRLLHGGAALAGATLIGGSAGFLASATAQDASPVAGEPQSGGLLSIAFEANPDNLNPFTMSSLVSALVVEQVYDTLFVFDENLASQPNLCVDFEAPDNTTYVFHLVQDATFSDGSPVTAEDVKFSLESYKDPEIGARSWASRIDTVEALDDHTVQVNLTEPYAPLIGYLSWHYNPIVSKAFYEANEGAIEQVTMGSGPFILEEFIPDQMIRFVRNENYWQDGLPYFDEMEWIILPDDQARVAALRGGEVQNADFLDYQAVQSFEDNPDWTVYEVPTLTHGTTVLNCAEGPLADARVRQAISYAIDREEFVQGAALGFAEVSGYIPASDRTWALPTSELPTYQTDLDRARDLLAEAGYEDGFDVTLRVSPLYVLDTANAQILQQQLQPLGINVQIEQLDWANLLDAWVNSDFEMLNILLLGLPDPDGYTWGRYHSESPTNYAQISDPDLDALMDEARSETDLDRRQELYNEIQLKLDELVPSLFYYVYNVWLVWVPNAQGVTPLPNSSAPYLKRVWLDD